MRAEPRRGGEGKELAQCCSPSAGGLWAPFLAPSLLPSQLLLQHGTGVLLDAFEGAALKRANVASSCFPQEMKGASLVVSWLRTHLAMQGTLASLVQEDPTCHGATMPMCHNYQAQAPPPEKPSQ